eukprot:TRINITY_DN484_c0_g1_i3.p1 TRINITY_DN484_c0_g1~~TRINITY_DN484_c0_g1_i3.p1  ORF type:complete len:257 (+),score=40.57 TRINITY_DN484_c0_g1_i3:41-811(+)
MASGALSSSLFSLFYTASARSQLGSASSLCASSVVRLQPAQFFSEKKSHRRLKASASASTSASASSRARLVAHWREEHLVEELERPIAEYMTLPASQYSVLDAERIERLDDKCFRCFVHRLKVFSFEICPVLLVRVDEQPNGCTIRLLSCTLEGSPVVEAQNKNFSATMLNGVSWAFSPASPTFRLLISDTSIEVTMEIPPAFSFLSKEVIESAGNQVLAQLLRVALPRFLQQLGKDYSAWALGDNSRKPLGTGEL